MRQTFFRFQLTLLLLGVMENSYGHGVSINGYIQTQAEVEKFKKAESSHLANLEFNTKRNHGLKGELELRFKTETNQTLIRKAIVNTKYDKKWRLETGYGKKRIGYEYEASKTNRDLAVRTLLYRKLEEFTYVGREAHLRYFRNIDPLDDIRGLSWYIGFSENNNVTVSSSLLVPISYSLSYGIWMQLVSDHIDDSQQTVGVMMSSLEWSEKAYHGQLEFLAGMDPDEMELRRLFGKVEEVYFWGLKAGGSYHIMMDEGSRVKALGYFSFLNHDIDENGYNALQYLVGINYYRQSLRLALNVEFNGVTSRLNPDDRSFADRKAIFELLFDF